LPHRAVHRTVQGVELWMPWSHRLPDYAAVAPAYGQNLVRLAALLTPKNEAPPLKVLDVGANIGDSTKQILAAADARVLAVEADPYYLGYLRRNVGGLGEVTIAEVLLTTEDDDSTWTPARRGGTTHFLTSGESVAAGEAASVPQAARSLSVNRLVDAYPEFADIRLVKSDTDGHDVELVPALARAYAGSTPVLFFEFDPKLTRQVAGRDADEVWPALAALGYETVGFWDHAGAPLGTGSCADAAARAAEYLTAGPARYLDVAVVHADDASGRAALAQLLPA
jgi:FkbM family methyltransferase